MLVRHVLAPPEGKFPAIDGGQGYIDGRLPSFRHYLASMYASNGAPERVVMEWVGHTDSASSEARTSVPPLLESTWKLMWSEARGRDRRGTNDLSREEQGSQLVAN